MQYLTDALLEITPFRNSHAIFLPISVTSWTLDNEVSAPGYVNPAVS